VSQGNVNYLNMTPPASQGAVSHLYSSEPGSSDLRSRKPVSSDLHFKKPMAVTSTPVSQREVKHPYQMYQKMNTTLTSWYSWKLPYLKLNNLSGAVC